MNGLFEILSNKEWMIQHEFVQRILPTLQYNITNHATLGIEREKKSPMAIGRQGQDFIREYQVTEDGTVLPVFDAWGEGDVLGKMKEPFVNVMPVDGPITRNGGACSYGSRDIRDWMMKAADNKFCQGHVLHINTPGGSAWAKNDFQQGIDYAHARGQRVIAFIDGLCASAGMYLAALCDEVYVMNMKDQLGCVGVMAAFFTMKNGEKDPYTGETYREYYDPESVDKNKQTRDIAEDEDATLLIEELRKLGEEFRADMKASFPNADIEEHLRGKIFDAKDVMGILCDGQMMLGEVIGRVFNLANGSEQPIERTAGRKIGKAANVSEASERMKISTLSTTLNNEQMKEKFPSLFAALQVEEMQMQEGGAFINSDLLATLNAYIEAKNKEVADAKALADSLTQERDSLKNQVNDLNTAHATAIEEKDGQISALEQEKADLQEKVDAQSQAEIDKMQETLHNAELMVEEKNNAIAALEQEKADLNDKLTGCQSQIEQLQADVDAASKGIEEANSKIADKDARIDQLVKQVEDLKAEVKELSNEERPLNDGAAGVPAGNGTGDAPKQKKRITSDMSYEEIRALQKEGK